MLAFACVQAQDVPMSRDLQTAKQKLLAHRAELDDLSRLSGEDRRAVELDQSKIGRLARMDAIQQQAMALATEERREQMRIRIAAALKRIDANEYGDCIRCGEEIVARRLELDPTKPLCLACAKGGA